MKNISLFKNFAPSEVLVPCCKNRELYLLHYLIVRKYCAVCVKLAIECGNQYIEDIPVILEYIESVLLSTIRSDRSFIL